MRLYHLATTLLFVTIVSSSCDKFTYNLHSRKKAQKEKPSLLLIQNIIEFRETYNSWPFSKEEFISKKQQYKQAFAALPYLTTRFDVNDNDHMTFYFSDHIKDDREFRNTGKIDLNAFAGEVRFYKEKDKFVWKIKMY